MTVTSKTKFIDQIESLPPLPRIVGRVLEVTKSPQTSAEDLARVLSEDQAMAAKILRVANSPFYGARGRVTQLTRAVVMLGSVAVRNQVIGICARSAVAPTAQASEDHETLWRHAIAVASASELIGRRIGFRPPVDAFIAGLLHDIGQLAMVVFQPKAFGEVLRDRSGKVNLLELERERLGLDHTEAGYRILTRWGLPDPVCRVVQHHHDESFDEKDSIAQLLALVMLGDTLAQVMGMGFDFPLELAKRAEAAVSFLGITESDQLYVLSWLEGRVAETDEMLAIEDSPTEPGEEAPPKPAVWFSGESGAQDVGRILLQHFGYEVRHASGVDTDAELPGDALMIIALSEDRKPDACRLASTLAAKGHRKLVMLADPVESDPPRRRHAGSGVLLIPRSFTAFDLRWAEEQLAA